MLSTRRRVSSWQVAALDAQSPSPSTSPSQPSAGSSSPTALHILIGVGVLLVLYVFYAWVQGREKVAATIQGKNIRANLHNLLVILLAVMIAVPLAKIGVTKLAASGAKNWPLVGPFVKALLQLVDAI